MLAINWWRRDIKEGVIFSFFLFCMLFLHPCSFITSILKARAPLCLHSDVVRDRRDGRVMLMLCCMLASCTGGLAMCITNGAKNVLCNL